MASGGVIGSMAIALTANIAQLMRDVERASAEAGESGSETFSQRFTGGVARMAGAVGLALGATEVKSFFSSAVSGASDLNETLSKTANVFGSQSDAMVAWAQNAATSFGLSKSEALAAAAGFGDMFTQLGFTEEAAAKNSQAVIQLATDLGSFNNLPTADVANSISSAFNGEYDSLQRMIPTINAATVEQQALTMTGKDNADALTQADKAAAVLALTQENASKAAGDFAETSGGLANQQKIAEAQFKDFKDTLGAVFLPIAEDVFGFINTTAIPALEDVVDWVKDVIAKFDDFKAALDRWQGPIKVTAGILTTLLAPAFIAVGVAALQMGAQAALGWAMQTAAAAVGYARVLVYLTRLGIQYVLAGVKALGGLMMTVGGWILSAVTAMASAVVIAAAWLIANWPIALIIAGILLIVGAFLWLWNNCEGFRDFWINLWETIQEMAAKAWDWIVEKFNWARERITAIITAVVEWVVDKFNTFRTTLTDIVSNVWQWIVDKFNWARDTLTNIIMGVVNWIVGKWYDLLILYYRAKALWEGIKDLIAEQVDKIQQRIADFVQGIIDRFTNAKDDVIEAGRNIVSGLWEGIQNMKQWLIDKVRAFVSAVIPGPIKAALGISSPSKVTAQLGHEVAMGLVVGMEREEPTVADASAGLAMAAVPAVSGGPAVGVPAGGGNVMVNVYIGEERLTEMIRTEVRDMARQAFVVEAMGV